MLNVYSAVIPYRCEAHSLWENLLLLAAAMLLTGIGAAVTVNMRLVPNPGDGIVAAGGRAAGPGPGLWKNLVDVCCVALTCVIGLTAAGRVVGVGLGTVAAMVCVGGSSPWSTAWAGTGCAPPPG